MNTIDGGSGYPGNIPLSTEASSGEPAPQPRGVEVPHDMIALVGEIYRRSILTYEATKTTMMNNPNADFFQTAVLTTRTEDKAHERDTVRRILDLLGQSRVAEVIETQEAEKHKASHP